MLLPSSARSALATLPPPCATAPTPTWLWLDAHADYNTPATTVSGYLGGMPLAGACGRVGDRLDDG